MTDNPKQATVTREHRTVVANIIVGRYGHAGSATWDWVETGEWKGSVEFDGLYGGFAQAIADAEARGAACASLESRGGLGGGGEGTYMVDEGSYNKGVYDATHGCLPEKTVCATLNCHWCAPSAEGAESLSGWSHIGVNKDRLPDSDVWVIAANDHDFRLVTLEFTDDSEGHGEPYWQDQEDGGEWPLERFPYWVAFPGSSRKLYERAESAESMVGQSVAALLSVLCRDGGHYLVQCGSEKAALLALEEVARLRQFEAEGAESMAGWARPESAWHEEIGDVLWWRFPIVEAPYVGSPLDTNWPGYHTHWTPITLPPEPTNGR